MIPRGIRKCLTNNIEVIHLKKMKKKAFKSKHRNQVCYISHFTGHFNEIDQSGKKHLYSLRRNITSQH